MQNKKHLIIIGGPTASGKTGAAIKLAQHFQTEIISADSRQFYQEMAIGTAKPTKEELAAAVHHFVDHISIHDTLTVGDYERDALKLLDRLFQTRDIVILSGGSGLFIRALCEGLDQFPDAPPNIRQELNERFKTEGIDFLQKELKSRDPAYFDIVDQNNQHRLIRALEVCIASGQPYSYFRRGAKASRYFTSIYIQLTWERAALYDRINRRVDQMVEMGLLDEARSLYKLRHLNALQTVGYQELFDYFDNKITLEKAIELIKRNSRRYAKRQLTWMRKDERWKAFKPEDISEMIQYVTNYITT